LSPRKIAWLMYFSVLIGGLARADAPPQTSGLRVLHRAGQTFITWKDAQDDFGDKRVTYGEIRDRKSSLRYRVYRHTRPIDAGNLKEARLLAEVEPLSGFNAASWSLERLVNQVLFAHEDQGELASYDPFAGWERNSPQGAKLITARLAIEDNQPLPPGSGLYVHSASAEEDAYYAVTTVDNGRENEALSAGNSLARPVREKVAAWQPVEQSQPGKFAFDFRGTRHYYVAWVAPPLAPKPMYFNWSVLVPPDCKEPVPVELYFHGPGMSYARPPTKLYDRSIQICPHDYPFSGWYGYNDALSRGKNAEEGVVRPYTIKRIEAFLKWAEGKFPADRSRVIAVGGDGAALMAIHRPELISCVFITRFQALQLDRKSAPLFEQAWGPSRPQIKDEAGRGQWTWGELDTVLCGKALCAVPKGPELAAVQPNAAYPGSGLKLPFFVCCGPSWGRDPDYGRGRGRFYYALQATRQGLCADWQWGGKLPAPAKFAGTWRGVDFTNDGAFPAIAFSSSDKDNEGSGNCNLIYSWSDVKEDAASFEVVISGRESTFDLTPRRLSKLQIAPGQRLAWEAVAIPVNPRGKVPEKQSGAVSADANGVVTLRGLQLAGETSLKVRIGVVK